MKKLSDKQKANCHIYEFKSASLLFFLFKRKLSFKIQPYLQFPFVVFMIYRGKLQHIYTKSDAKK